MELSPRIDYSSVTLSVTEWGLTIQKTLTTPNATTSIDCHCHCPENQLQLSNGQRVSELPIGLTILSERGVPNELPERGLGRFSYMRNDEIFGWFILPPERYNEVWAQANFGAFAECTIRLEIAPLDPGYGPALWNVADGELNSLFILGAVVHFKHRRQT